ncbi:hypothetical protein LRS06_14625 [Hymenobacter sp. J193]|uniref:hypothetical protein n=1 Tax=Hymenobacter sp. J193 TaxID=2898429 RepID=UPI002150B05D|nr:hypothetical protein [Hymenobacter sp. J193]MCR5888979.1 hypothetical protein [Hymenobacter sp. J193]
MKKLVIFALWLVLLTTLRSVAPMAAQAQCTMCKTQVEASRSDKDGYDTSGLNKGILYLMTIPYLLIGTVGFWWYRNNKKKKLAQR